MSKISDALDKVFSPDIRVFHNELGEIIRVNALTNAGRDYMRENVLFRGMDIDGLSFPDLFVEYIDTSSSDN